MKRHADSKDEGHHRLAFLDALRGIAALIVFLYHATQKTPWVEQIILRYNDFGQLGVVAFFLCSGFIIPISLEHQGSLRMFWIRRVLRLYPLYWFSIAAVVMLILLGFEKPNPQFVADPIATILANMTMFQAFFGYKHMMVVYWTLLFEMLFYLIVSAMFAARILRYTTLICVAFIACSFGVEVLLPLITNTPVPFGLISCFTIMFCGTLFYRWYVGQTSTRTLLFVIGASLATMISGTIVDSLDDVGKQTAIALAGGRLGGFGLFGLCLFAGRWQMPRPLLYVGQISYSIYLTHEIVIILIPKIANSLLVTLIVQTTVLLLLATVSYRLIERPTIKLGRWLSRQSQPLTSFGAKPTNEHSVKG